MPKFIFVFAFLFFFVDAIGQNTITVKGKITNSSSKIPIESVTVYLSKAKDSSLIDYTITDKNGLFDLKIKKIKEPTILKISNLGFDDFKKTIPSIDADVDFGTIQITEGAQLLGEIVVKSEAPPIRIKKDTLEFNAASFKVRPDANVETLLKQLPGVEIATDGKITVNGKEVNQILVNGKPFFDKDGKIALQSLPSDIINKVQISDTKSKKEELTGKAASSNNTSINLTIDEDKNKGFFGKFMGGFGTDDRYESSGLINYFKNKRKISVLASSNNINSTGFSMDEIFDNMGGGRSNFYYNDNGQFSFGGMRFGAGKGITQSNMFGVNYGDEWGKDFEINGSYFFNNSNAKNTNKTRTENLLPTGKFTTESNAKTVEDRFAHNVKFELDYKIDSTTTITFMPKFAKASNKFKSAATEFSKDESNQLLNESTAETLSETETDKFTNSINFNKAFKRKGRNLNVSFDNENSKEILEDLNQSTTVFHQSTKPDDIRNQIRKNQNIKNIYGAEIDYSEPIKDSIFIKLGASVSFEKATEDKNTFDFNTVSEAYDVRNDSLTNFLSSTKNSITPKAGFSIEKKKYNFNFDAGTTITQLNNSSLYFGETTSLKKEYALPYLSTYLNYKFSKTKSLWVNYYYNVSFPLASQLLPVENIANPLNTVIGNPDLNPNKSHSIYFSFRDFKAATKSGYSVYLNGNYYDSQIVSSSIFDSNRKRTTTYYNIDGNYSFRFGFNWNKTIKNEAHTFKFSAGTNINYSLSKGFTNEKLYEAKDLAASLRANFTYEYGELFTINPSYSVTFSDVNYSNYSVKTSNNGTHRFNMQTTNYWPKNWVFGNDFGYTYNSNIADGFKKDFYLWNTSLSYSFFDKKIMAKVKVYDVLDQNQSATRSISATMIRDEENIVLKRYMMFSLTYKIEKFAGKEKPARNGGFRY